MHCRLLVYDLLVSNCFKLRFLYKIIYKRKRRRVRSCRFISNAYRSIIDLVNVVDRVSGHCRPGKIQNDNDGLLQRRDGLHPNVRYHERGVVQFGARLGNADQNVLVRQCPSDLGRQQVRHGGRKGDHHREGQAIGGPAGRPVL